LKNTKINITGRYDTLRHARLTASRDSGLGSTHCIEAEAVRVRDVPPAERPVGRLRCPAAQNLFECPSRKFPAAHGNQRPYTRKRLSVILIRCRRRSCSPTGATHPSVPLLAYDVTNHLIQKPRPIHQYRNCVARSVFRDAEAVDRLHLSTGRKRKREIEIDR